jgi:excisionase family DNA binding protein
MTLNREIAMTHTQTTGAVQLPVTGQILTVAEVALELRCSRAHVYNVIAGKGEGVRALPAIAMGRRKLVRRSALEHWMETNETAAGDGNMASSSAIDTAGRMKETVHA